MKKKQVDTCERKCEVIYLREVGAEDECVREGRCWRKEVEVHSYKRENQEGKSKVSVPANS